MSDNIIRSKSWNVKTLIIIGVFFTFHFSFFTSARGQASLGADTIALGDQTVLTVPVVDSLPRLLLPPQVVALEQNVDTATRSLLTTVTSFEPGEWVLHIGNDDSLLLVVTDVEVDTTTTEIRDIAPIQRIPYTFWEIFRWVLLALAVAAVAFGVWWVLTHRQKLQQVLGSAEPVDTRTPEERALQALETLRNSHLWQNGKVKEYHTELTDIVRRFIEEATGVRATEMTSDETVEALGGQWSAVSGQLKSIFATADLVKFAKSEPLPHEHEASLSRSVEFVKAMWQEVKPQEEPADEEAAKA